MTPKRYTIEFSIKEVDETGDTFGPELAGVTMDWCTTDLQKLEGVMDEAYDFADSILHDREPYGDDITERHESTEDEQLQRLLKH